MLARAATIIAIGVAALFGVAACAPDEPKPPAAPSAAPRFSEYQIDKALFAAGRLWLRDTDGGLWSVDPSKHDATREPLASGEKLLDFCVRGAEVIAVTGAGEHPKSLVVSRRTGSDWSSLAAIPSQDAPVVGVACDLRGPVLLTTRQLITFSDGPPRSVRLSGPAIDLASLPARSTLLLTDQNLFVGLDSGEWGGGLRSVDRASGRSISIEDKRPGEICDEPLDSGCDGVANIVPAPRKPGCIVAAVNGGFPSNGRLVTVCAGRVKGMTKMGPCPGTGLERCAESIIGLTRLGDNLMVVRSEGLTTVWPDGRLENAPFPKFERYGPFDISFGQPGMAMVRYTFSASVGDISTDIRGVAQR